MAEAAIGGEELVERPEHTGKSWTVGLCLLCNRYILYMHVLLCGSVFVYCFSTLLR